MLDEPHQIEEIADGKETQHIQRYLEGLAEDEINDLTFLGLGI